MAVSCAKCGSTFLDNVERCPVCGAPATPSAAAQPAAPAYQPVAPVPPAAGQGTYSAVPAQYSAMPAQPPAMPAQPLAAPAKSGGALKVVLIIVAVFVVLGILGLGIVGYTVYRIGHAVRQAATGEHAIVTPAGTFSANSLKAPTASELGVDIYPGAKADRGGASMTTPSGSVMTAIFVTTDSKEQVVNFYKAKLGSSASVFDMNNTAMISSKKGEQESVMITVSEKDSQADGKTRISIVHSKSNKPS